MVIFDADAAKAMIGMAPPALPWIAGTILRVDDLAATQAYLSGANLRFCPLGRSGIAVAGPPELGGVFVFTGGEVGALLG